MDKLKELQIVLDAWYTAFGTTQLTHAVERLRIAETRALKPLDEGEVEKEIRRCALGYVEDEQDIVRISITNISQAICQAHKEGKLFGKGGE